MPKSKAEDQYTRVPLNKLIVSGFNVRRRDIIADVDELARNIKRHNLQQPIVVQPKGDKFEILIGQRRYLAARELGWRDIPARILAEPLDEMEARIASFSENALRRDLEPRDKSEVIQYLFQKLRSVSAVADELGVSEPTVRTWLGYAAVPDELRELVDEGRISRPQAQRLWEGIADKEKAVEIGRIIGQRKRTPREKSRIITAAEELPDRSIPTILHRADQLKTVKAITFILPEKWARAIATASRRLDKEEADIARDAVIEWLNRYDFFAGP